MDKIFGIPMSGIMVFLLIVLALCLCTVLWIALRQPIIFKMGIRNIPRRKTQTALILIGLMLATVISTAALGMGDTISTSLTAGTYDALGQIDELVVFSSDPDANVNNALGAKMPASSLQTVEQALANDPNVDGIMPALLDFVPAISSRTKLSTPEVYLIGIDPSRVDQFGGLKSTSGDNLDLTGLAQNEVFISDSTADELDAKVGDVISIYYGGQPTDVTVKGIAEDSPLSGVINLDANPGMVVPLDRLQAFTNQPDQLSFIGISNTGGVKDGVDRTDAVVDKLEAALAGQPLGIDAIKQNAIEQTELASSGLTGLFLILGLFSIAVGVLLIILIFSMLAAERRPEMGMARAVGQHRRQMIQQFVAEGTGYALLAGIVGVLVGVGVTFALGEIFGSIIGDFFRVEPTVTWKSAIIGYCLGVVITFVAVVVSSWRASRVNVVAAIRDLPDVKPSTRRKRTLVYAFLMIFIGALFILLGQTGDVARAFLFYTGMSLLPFGIALVARFFGAPIRPVFSIVGIYILVLWLLPGDVSRKLFGDLGGDFEMFFLSGIFMVAGATILIVQNLDMLLGLVSKSGNIFKSRLPAVRTAIAYPGAAKGRTGMTIAMFSLIVFSLVCFATISENFANLFLSDDADAGWDVQVQVSSSNQFPDKDLKAALTAAGADTTDITAVGWSDDAAPAAAIRVANSPDPDYKAISLNGMNDSLIQDSDLRFQNRAEGYDSDDAIVQALLTQPNVAVVDSSTLEGQGGGFGGASDPFVLDGVKTSTKVFAPVQVQLLNPTTGQPVDVTIIGVIDSDLSTLFGMYANHTLTDQVYPNPPSTTYRVRLSDPGNAKERAKQIESALLGNGAQAQSYKEIQEDGQATFRGFLTLIQGFMGLGLIVGIAAVGVIAFRAVVERRQQIGVLRAIGFQKSLVSASFLIETTFVVGIGVISGTVLGLALSYILFSDPEFTGGNSTNFVVPWPLVVIILAIAFAMALVMTWIPSRQAASIAPAEALRYE